MPLPKKLVLLPVIVILLITACGGGSTTTLPPMTSAAPASPLATATPLPPTPTATPPPDPEGAALAFLAAYEARDYLGMYTWLVPSVQAQLDAKRFATLYQSALDTATVLTVTTQLRSALREGATAQVAFHLTWETALVGSLEADQTMTLRFEGGRWGVDWHEGLIWPDLEGGNLLYMDWVIPSRANIYDREGQGLAVDSRLVTVGVVPGEITDEQALLNTLSAVTGLTPAEIQARYAGQPADWYIPIADIPFDVSQAYRDALEQTPGLRLGEKDARYYRDGGIAPHIVGYVGPIPAERLAEYRAQGYRGDEWVGVAGLEAWGEPYLAGEHGGTLQVITPQGEVVKTLAERKGRVSRPLYTTLNREFQRQVQEILGDRTGAIVVLDPRDGSVLAMASGPSFDPNAFVAPLAGNQRTAILADPRRPLLNRATQGIYPLGSVFKIITMAAALEKGKYTPDTLYTCTGIWTGLGPGAIKKDWLEGGHGTITLVQGLERSCDPYFYDVGLALFTQDPQLLSDFARAFGLGQPTGIVGIPEVAGLVPDPRWKLENLGEGWSAGDGVNLAIGQGFLTVTPLQVARYVAAIVNGGILYRPRVIDRIGAAPDGSVPEEPFPAQAVERLPVSEETLAAIRRGMEGATQRWGGTAFHRFRGLSIPVAGKTGTAEAPGAEALPHAWFAGYAPADDPQIVVVVLVENAGEGSAVAAPLFRQVVEAYFGLPLTPLPPEAIPPYATPTPPAP